MIKPDSPLPGFLQSIDQLNPEVIKAQCMAELKGLAEYRQRHLQAIKEWSDPEKRAKRIEEMERAQKEARVLVSTKAEEFANMFDISDIKPMTIGRTIERAMPLKWYQRIAQRVFKK